MSFFSTWFGILVLTLLKSLAVIVPLLIGVAYLTYAERKVLGSMQLRKGPNVVGPFGLAQPFADAIKMLFKETIIPAGSDRALFVICLLYTSWAWRRAWRCLRFQAFGRRRRGGRERFGICLAWRLMGSRITGGL